MKKRWCFYCLKNSTIFRDTNRNQDSSSWEKRCKNFQSGITFTSSLTTSLKLQYETKHGLLFVCLFVWFYLSMFSCSHWYSKSYDTPLLFVFKHQSMLPTTVIHSTCNFFLIIYSDLIKNLKANLWEKFMACIIKQLLPDCRLTEYYRSKQSFVSLMHFMHVYHSVVLAAIFPNKLL